MNRCKRIFLSLILPLVPLIPATLWMAFGAGSLAAGADQTSGPAQIEEQVLQWVRHLDSDLFIEREMATERLIRAGVPAVGPIVAALATNNLEVTTRGIYILQELALQSDLATAEAARAALEQVSRPRATSAARRAAEALARLDVVRHERSLEELKRLGAAIGARQSDLGFQLIEQLSVEIGETWRGETADLARLRWLRGVDELILSNRQLDDEALRHVGGMAALPSLVIRRVPVTDRGIAHLGNLPGLQRLSVLYAPIGDAAVQSLAAVKGLTDIRLYGTQLTAAGQNQLAMATAATLDVRRGGFLGIGGDPTQAGCVIYTVQPNTAADKAGLMVGDLIQEFEGTNVTDFKQLTALIAEHAGGETVAMKILRGQESLIKKITLGERERLE